MKILLIVHHELDPNSGAAGSTLNLTREYEKCGHEVSLYSFDDLPADRTTMHRHMFFPWYVAAHLRRRLKTETFDVIDATTVDTWIWAAFFRTQRMKRRTLLITRSTGLEHVVALQSNSRRKMGLGYLKDAVYHQGIRLKEVTTSLRLADVTIFLNGVDRDFAIEKLGVRAATAHVCPNGVPSHFMNLPFEEFESRADRPIRIAEIGRYTSDKGADYSTAALIELMPRYPNLFVSFIGTGGEPDAVHAKFPPELRERIAVTPKYANSALPDLLRGHEIIIFPSLTEGFGKSLIEGMCCGLAAVTTTAAGPSEIVTDGHDGFIVPTRDANAIRDAVTRLVEDPAERLRMRRNAHETGQKYSWASSAKRRLSIYDKHRPEA